MPTEEKKTPEKDESLNKSIDSLIDDLFTEEVTSPPEAKTEQTPENTEEPVEKSSKDSKMKVGANKTQADEGEKPKKAKKEKEDENGRPKEVQDVPETDTDGSRAKGYDHIQKPNSATPSTSAKGTVVKSEEKYEISPEDYEMLQKAKEAQKEEALQKAKDEQTSLIKSAVSEATADIKKENEELKKSVAETNELLKALTKKPQPRKSIENIQALEKSQTDPEGNPTPQRQEAFSKSEMMDVAEELVKSRKITMEQAIELDDTGGIFDAQARKTLENELKKRG